MAFVPRPQESTINLPNCIPQNELDWSKSSENGDGVGMDIGGRRCVLQSGYPQKTLDKCGFAHRANTKKDKIKYREDLLYK